MEFKDDMGYYGEKGSTAWETVIEKKFFDVFRSPATVSVNKSHDFNHGTKYGVKIEFSNSPNSQFQSRFLVFQLTDLVKLKQTIDYVVDVASRSGLLGDFMKANSEKVETSSDDGSLKIDIQKQVRIEGDKFKFDFEMPIVDFMKELAKK